MHSRVCRKSFRQKDFEMKITYSQIITIVGLVAGVWAIFFGKGILELLPKNNICQFNNARIFLIKVEQNVYQIGIIAKVINLSDDNQEIDYMFIKKGELGILSRTTNYIQAIYNRVCYPIIVENNILVANAATNLKLLTPIKIKLLDNNVPLAPEIVFTGKWLIKRSRGIFKTISGDMRYYSTYEKYISVDEWNRLLKPSSGINVEDINLKLAPIDADLNMPAKIHLLWNRDPTAKINIYGFTESYYAHGANGTMVFVAGNGNLNLENGWEILGSNYNEVWADRQKRMLYNSIYPPSESEEPRAFAAFMGAEDAMGVNAPVPTTRAATFLHIQLLDPEEWKKGNTRGQENLSFMGIAP